MKDLFKKLAKSFISSHFNNYYENDETDKLGDATTSALTELFMKIEVLERQVFMLTLYIGQKVEEHYEGKFSHYSTVVSVDREPGIFSVVEDNNGFKSDLPRGYDKTGVRRDGWVLLPLQQKDEYDYD